MSTDVEEIEKNIDILSMASYMCGYYDAVHKVVDDLSKISKKISPEHLYFHELINEELAKLDHRRKNAYNMCSSPTGVTIQVNLETLHESVEEGVKENE